MKLANLDGDMILERSSTSARARFCEAYGRLDIGPSDCPAIAGDTVMLTNIDKGSAPSRPANGLTIRYVAQGEERYRFGPRCFRLSEGQLMISSQRDGAEIDIRRNGAAGTLGLCAFLAESDAGLLETPIVIGAKSSPVGTLMELQLKALLKSTDRTRQAGLLVDALRLEVPKLVDDLSAQTDRLPAKRSRTRLDAVSKVGIARNYLHSTTERAVRLDELAAVAGVSPFHLQRMFRQAIGQSPAVYHRRLRLTLALSEARRRRLTIEAIADDYGFAGASGLSHAHTRTFGRSPVWTKKA